MIVRFPSFSTSLLAIALAPWCIGCGENAPRPPQNAAPAEHGHDDHEDGHEHSHDHGAGEMHEHPHGGEALTEKDIEMPTSVDAGVDRLDELHGQIAQQIESKELSHVHHTAEEMALVAKALKKLAPNVVEDDKLTEFGRLCNDIADCYQPIDEAADAGKAAETTEIHAKMGKDIQRLKELLQ